MTGFAHRSGVLAALGLAVLAALSVVLPDPVDLGDSPALRIWGWIGLGVGGAFFLVLVVNLVGGRGWGPAGPRRPETSFGAESVAAVGLFFLLPVMIGGVALALLGDGLVTRIGGQGAANVLVVALLLLLWRLPDRGRDEAAPAPFRRSTVIRDLLWGAALALALLPALDGATRIGGVLLRAMGQEPALQDLVGLIRDEGRPGVLVGAGVFVTILAPLAEEMVFRGFVYTGLRRVAGPGRAAVASAVLFALIHGSPYASLPLFGLGLALAFLYERNGSLTAPVALHGAFNGLQFVGILLSAGASG
jgi:membrane protease YdiL (CAAX protease family)